MRTERLLVQDWIARQLPIAILIGALGCGGAAAPLSPDSSSSAATTGYSVSGVVTDDFGSLIPNAVVILDHGPNLPDLNAATLRLTTRSGGDGRYQFSIAPGQVRAGAEPFAMIRAYTYTNVQTHSANVQLVAREGTSATRNIRLTRLRVIGAGQSAGVPIDADSSLCDFGDISLTTRCEWVRIVYDTYGTLTVEARSQTGGIVPTLRTWRNAGQGTLTELADDEYGQTNVAIQVPVGTAPQGFTVSATIR
jgi:hypothetical protein